MYKIPNWGEFQQYKDRRPTWIKFHKTLLDNRAFQLLPLSPRAMLPMLWLLASEHPNIDSGLIELSEADIAYRLRITEAEVKKNIELLITSCFIIDVRNRTDFYKNVPREEKRREETEKIKAPSAFDEFWELFPRQRRGSKEKAYRAWGKAMGRSTAAEVLAGLIRYARSTDVSSGYAKGADSWLNADGWTNTYEIGTKPTSGFGRAGL